jgi:serine phosphatase RsbU (regulator of sigma subunit)
VSRVLLLMAHRENRRLLADWLATRHQVVLPDARQGLEGAFDLCVLDGPALTRLGRAVQAAKRAVQPIFLPFLLVTHRQDVGLATRQLWESVDEVIVSPIEKAELQARVENVLRARQLSLQNAALRRRLEEELRRAAEVQAELLPRQVPALPGFELAACCVPAREVGGDFYDWQEVGPGVLSLTVGDVMGKGMAAALLMTTVRATLRGLAQLNPPATALDLLRRALEPDLERTSSFVTLFHARLETASRRLAYADAGHGHAFLLRQDGALERLPVRGMPVGFPARTPYEEGVVEFRPSDALVIYSDGLVEIRPGEEVEPATLGERLRGATSAAEMVERLADQAARAGTPADDLTVVVLRCAGG